MTAIGTRIKELRLARGLSQRDLAEPGYSRAYLSMIEAGRSMPSADALRCFAGKLGLPSELDGELRGARRDVSAGRPNQYPEILALSEAFALTEQAYAARCGLGEMAIHSGRFAEALEVLPDKGLLAIARRVTCLALAGDPVSAVALCERALAAHGPHPRLHAAAIMPYNQIGAFERMGTAADQALALLTPDDEPELLAFVFRAVTQTYIERREFDTALWYVDRALAHCHDLPTDAGLCHLARASAFQEADRLVEAADALTVAIELLDGTHATAFRDRAIAVLAGVRLRLGATGEALRLTATVTEPDPWTAGYLHRIAGLASGDEEEFRLSAELFAAQGGRADLVETCRAWARMLVGQGRLAEAVEIYDRGLLGASTTAQA